MTPSGELRYMDRQPTRAGVSNSGARPILSAIGTSDIDTSTDSRMNSS